MTFPNLKVIDNLVPFVSNSFYAGSKTKGRINIEAEQLLLKSDLTVLQISERFGFCDQFYFSRRFKMKYGETPQKYRKLRLI